MTSTTAAQTRNGQRNGANPRSLGESSTGAGDGARVASDDEILGIEYPGDAALAGHEADWSDREAEEKDAESEKRSHEQTTLDKSRTSGDAEKLRETLEANPELKSAWEDAKAYREEFATPKEAHEATALLADLDRMDSLFFSRRPEDHAELARSVAELDAEAFASLVKAMRNEAERPAIREAGTDKVRTVADRRVDAAPTTHGAHRQQDSGAQAEFFQTANAAAVQGVLDAIESQVERLLPEGASKSARNRVTGEIYRELDATLRDNRQFAEQVRDAFRSGAQDAQHQRAIVSLITGRARQALPGVAKRVMNEWTSTMVAANQDRRVRQRAAERRVDIAGAGGGNDGRRSMTPRDIDYARMSDAEILNL